jgi:hypothetical protein
MTVVLLLNLSGSPRPLLVGECQVPGEFPAGAVAAVRAVLEVANQPARSACGLHACDADALPQTR